MENAQLTLSQITDEMVIIDEIQRRPELFPLLRVLVDEHEKKRRFLILGSASRDLIRQSSETLAGRIGYLELDPFGLEETDDIEKLWLRGGFPKSFLADDDTLSLLWRQEYILSFLERDIPNLGFHIPPEQIRRFWLMLAHYHGQIFQATEIGKSLGVSHHTTRKYLDILVGTFMLRVLTPWFENISKRQVKSPKIYFRDNGILHALLGIKTHEDLNVFPRLGAFWEGFALEMIIREYDARSEECYFFGNTRGCRTRFTHCQRGKEDRI